MENKNVTIKDVAELAGVSKSTVSRVLSDSPRISQATKNKVYEAMKELGYHPNEIARSLANSKSNTLGIVMPNGTDEFYSNSFFQESLRGISHIAMEKGYDILISTSKNSELEVAKKFIQSKKVDGIILMRSRVQDETIEFLRRARFPFVLIGSSLEYDDVNVVDNDNFLASYQLTEHIINRGRKKIAFIGGNEASVVTVKRIEGYKKALKIAGLQEINEFIMTDDFQEQNGYNSVEKLFQMKERPDGIIVADDMVCIGVMKKLKELGCKVPEDIAVGAFNDSMFSKYSTPAITSVEVCSMTLGEKAATMLIKLINKENVEQKIIVSHSLLIRESTK